MTTKDATTAAMIPSIRCLAEPPDGSFKPPTAIEAWVSRDQLETEGSNYRQSRQLELLPV
ncbi:hypothetical protein [Bradyrhizobium sp.]|uniref:hypothetical protein n=1 Tax=Bradyrhizobium sp. TaxID=376 RepID=UPI002CAFD91A|nr:hypothetical protein [Bradyrhizobium sp.]HMM89543.1 hypothetical protein [Bradyrhizobium sp.]